MLRLRSMRAGFSRSRPGSAPITGAVVTGAWPGRDRAATGPVERALERPFSWAAAVPSVADDRPRTARRNLPCASPPRWPPC